jgi:hypothetical protein
LAGQGISAEQGLLLIDAVWDEEYWPEEWTGAFGIKLMPADFYAWVFQVHTATPGQNTDQPRETVWQNHAFVRYTNNGTVTYFDPSYGLRHGDFLTLVRDSIASYGYLTVDGVQYQYHEVLSQEANGPKPDFVLEF